jgi:hypothetical protein
VYQVEIRREDGPATTLIAHKRGDVYDIVQWLQQQLKWLRKEPCMVPQLKDQEPLEGLG